MTIRDAAISGEPDAAEPCRAPLWNGPYRIESPRVRQRREMLMFRQYESWWSGSLGRPMEFLWFGQFGRPVLMFPTSGGRFFGNDDFHLTGSVADKVDRGEIQLICVDSVDNESWYNKNIHPAVRAARHAQFDAY